MTKTNEERKAEFLADLKALLVKHNGSISLEEDSRGYSGSTYHIEAYLEGCPDDEGYIHGVEVNLGTYFDGKE